MSYQAVEAVMQRSQTTGSERLLLMVIATHADAETMTAYLGETTLCKETNMKERNFHYTLAKLKQSGELKCVTGGGRGRANTYTLTLPPASDKPCNSLHSLSDERVQPVAGFEEAKGCNPSSERVQSVVERVQSTAPQPEEPERTEEGEEPRARDPRGFPFDHPAVALYVEQMKPNPELSIELATKIAAEVKRLNIWRQVLVVFSGNGYRGGDNSGRNVGNVIYRYWKECDKADKEAASDGTRTQPQQRNGKPTREETYHSYDYSGLDGAEGEGAGGLDREVPADEWLAATPTGRPTGDDRRVARSSRH